jgi:carbonic anhydrase
MTLSSKDMVEAARVALHRPSATPTRKLAVVTCMDARVDPWRLLSATPGEIHVIRNAGGVVTEDVLRSLFISQRELGTNRIMVLMHTECGMEGIDEGTVVERARHDLGTTVGFALGGFEDVHAELRRAVLALRDHSLLIGAVTGAIYDVPTDSLHMVPV